MFPHPKRISLSGGNTDSPTKEFRLASEASARFIQAASSLGFRGSDSASIEIAIASGVESSYTVAIEKNGIQIHATDEAYAFYALITLDQILAQYGSTLPNLRIEDYPDLPTRGFMLDISRCKVPTQQSIYQLVDALARLKYNQLQLYTEHTFAYRDHEIVWHGASPMTPEEIQNLDSYCFNRYIELVPNQNTFGHMERWLRHPSYHHLAECPNGFEHPISGWKQFGSTLKPDQASLDFVTGLLDELLPNFRSKTINIGGDEPWELGQGASQERVDQCGKHPVYLEHLLKIQEAVSAKGRRSQFWGDIILESPELVDRLPPSTTALIWGYETNHPFSDQCRIMRNAKIPYFVVPGTSTWNSIGGRLNTALVNIESAVRNAVDFEAQGVLLTEWGDNGHHQNHLLKIPSLLYAAGLSWNASKTRRDSLPEAAHQFFSHILTRGDFLCMLSLGRVPEQFSTYLHNQSWLNKVLFSNTTGFEAIRDSIKESEVESCIEILSTLSPTHSSLILSRDLLLFAANKALAILKGLPIPTIPESLLQRYSTDWLNSNRPGGLDESLALLRDANQ